MEDNYQEYECEETLVILPEKTVSENQVEYSFEKWEYFFAPMTIFGSYLLVEFGIFHFTTLLMTLVVLTILFGCRYYVARSGRICAKKDNWLFVLLCIFALAYSYTSNGFICFLVTLFEAIGVCVFCYQVGREETVSDFGLPFVVKCAVFRNPFRNNAVLGKSVLEGLNETEATKNFKYAAIGLFLTVPLTATVGNLLVSADDGVGRILQSLGNRFLPDIGNFIWKFVLSLILACLFMGMLYTSVRDRSKAGVTDEECERKLAGYRIAPSTVLCAGVLPICLLYGIFFYSQANYLLAAFSHQLPEGFSYAEYARQGFFELCILALINLGVILAMQLLRRIRQEGEIGIPVFTMILCGFTLFLLATAFRKMVLYVERFGLTPLRFYTSWFMVLLTVIFVLIMLWQVKRIPVFRCSSVTFLVWFTLLVFSRPDMLIARYNYEAYKAGILSGVDYSLFEQLSDDAWGYLGNCEEVPEGYRKERIEKLTEDTDYMLNLSSFLAYRSLR